MSELKWTSIKVIGDRLLRDPLFIGLNYETMVDYLVDFIQIVGTPELFDEKVTETLLQISNYRATLPVDFLEPIQISIDKYLCRQSPDTFKNYYSAINTYLNEEIERQNQEFFYSIKGDYIYTSKQTGEILMVYKAIKISKTK